MCFESTVVSAAFNMFCLNSHRISMGSSVSSHWERWERESSKVVRNLLPNTDGIMIALSAYLCLSVELWMLWICVWRISNALRAFTQRRISIWVLIFTTSDSLEKHIWLFKIYLHKSVFVCECVYKKREAERKKRKTPRLHSSLILKSTDKSTRLYNVGSLWKSKKLWKKNHTGFSSWHLVMLSYLSLFSSGYRHSMGYGCITAV